jgi:iron-sulfur cluster insertion protein
MNAMNEMPAPLVFTDSAAAESEVADRGGRQPRAQAAVFVSGGGARASSTASRSTKVTNEDDTAMVKDGVTLLIDPMSYQYLVGAEIDYQEGLEGAQFVIKNPNAHDHLRLRLVASRLLRRIPADTGPWARFSRTPLRRLASARQSEAASPPVFVEVPLLDLAPQAFARAISSAVA